MNPHSHQPAGYHTLIPFLAVEDAPALIDFLRAVFDASEGERLLGPEGKIMHVELRIGDSTLMLSDANGQCPAMKTSLYVYVQDVDATYKRALAAGAKEIMAPADMFWGDRFSSVEDPWGNRWSPSSVLEIVSPEDLKERAREFMQQN